MKESNPGGGLTPFRLIVHRGSQLGLAFTLNDGTTALGRAKDNAIELAEPSVSSHHCEIIVAGSEVIIRDLNATNGTFIDSQQVTAEALLKPGQILRLGEIELRLEAGSPSFGRGAAPMPPRASSSPASSFSKGSGKRINIGTKLFIGVSIFTVLGIIGFKVCHSIGHTPPPDSEAVSFRRESNPIQLAATSPHQAESGLVAYWSFNEGSGYTIHDSSVHGRSGFIPGECQWTNGHLGSGLWFNGTNTGFTFSAGENILKNGAEGDSFSMCAWVKPELDFGEERLIVGKLGFHAGIIANSTNGESTFSFQIWTPMGSQGMLRIRTQPILHFDQWHFVSAVYDSRSVTLYVDGKKASQGKLEGDIRTYGDDFTIGGPGFKGAIDEVRFYTRALTPGEIFSVMTNPTITAVSLTPTMGTPPDLQGFIDTQLRAGEHRVVVPPGRYRVTPRGRQHLVLHDLSDVQIIADNVELICTETTRALTIDHCTNVTVRGLVIDYDPLPFTQGRITGFSDGKKNMDVELFEGYPDANSARNFKFEIFRPDTRVLRDGDRYPKGIEVVDARHLRVLLPGEHDDAPEQIGDLVVIASEFAPHGSFPHAVYCSQDVHVRLEDIDLFASNGFGFCEKDCDGSMYYHCRIKRRSEGDDLVKRANPRLRSLNADAFHSIDAIQGPAYLGCEAHFMGDDCVCIRGDYHLVMAAHGPELRVLAKYNNLNNNMNIRPGDPVELMAYDGQRLPDANVVAVKESGSIADNERIFLSHQQIHPDLKSGDRAPSHVYAITLDREVRLPMGSVICSANRAGNGFLVKDCQFGFNRSRGIIIKASHGEVSNNYIEGTHMQSILVSPEYFWLEGDCASDVKITGNTIRDCAAIPICVQANGGNGNFSPAGAHRNIVISDNTIADCGMPGIMVTSTAGLKLTNNTLDLHPSFQVSMEMVRQARLKEVQSIMEINCDP